MKIIHVTNLFLLLGYYANQMESNTSVARDVVSTVFLSNKHYAIQNFKWIVQFDELEISVLLLQLCSEQMVILVAQLRAYLRRLS